MFKVGLSKAQVKMIRELFPAHKLVPVEEGVIEEVNG
jgi:hypothetical protein